MTPNTKQVCDNCRLRKTKCDRGDPCNSCIIHDIPCSYLHNPRRRGPKGGKGKRLTLIKQGLATHPVITNEDPALPFQPPGGSNIQTKSLGVGVAFDIDDAGLSSLSPVHAPHSFGPASIFPLGLESLSTILTAHIHLFMSYIFPILPVVDGPVLLQDAARLDSLPVSKYAVLLSLAATTRIQLKLDQDKALETNLLPSLQNQTPVSGPQLLAAAEAAHLQANVVDNMTLDAIVTGFFLFTANGNLEKGNKAWFYLSQAITLAIMLGLNREDAVTAKLAMDEVDMRRRIFWLLYISERTYALQTRRPILLRGRVPKPRVKGSSTPLIMNDFVNHTRLFESLHAELYNWDVGEDRTVSHAIPLHDSITSAICAVQPLHSVLESQQFDTLVTQQWLRVAMWRLVHGNSPGQRLDYTAAGFELPFEAGKSIMAALNSVSNRSKDCHGISIEQKLFDIGMSLVDISPLISHPSTAMAVGPQDLLQNIVKTLGCIRGVQSHLLPTLVHHSEHVLALSQLDAWSEALWADIGLPLRSVAQTGFVLDEDSFDPEDDDLSFLA